MAESPTFAAASIADFHAVLRRTDIWYESAPSDPKLLGAETGTWFLRPPHGPPVRPEFIDVDFLKAFLTQYPSFWEDFDRHLNMTFTERLIMMHVAPRVKDDGDSDYEPWDVTTVISLNRVEYEKQPMDIVVDVWFPCCGCGDGYQLIDIPRVVFAAWFADKGGGDSFDAMIRAAAIRTKYPRVLAATLSAYAPQKAYDKMCARLDEINDELAELHKAMVNREEQRELRNFDRSGYLDAYEEASVLSMLEKLYSYVSHGSSIGVCNLCNWCVVPRFVLDPIEQSHSYAPSW